MAEIRPFVLVQDWMFDLGLNISEVMAVAVIYGFTQGGEHTCHASLPYFQRRCALSKQGVVDMLKRIEAKGILKVDRKSGKQNEYSLNFEVVKKLDQSENLTRQETTQNPSRNLTPFPHSPYPDNKDNKYITTQGACDARVRTHEGGSENPPQATPQPPSPPVPSGDESGLFYVSSVQRDRCDFDPDRIAEVKRKKMSEALDRAAARLESEGLRMSPEQRARFLDHWCAHRPGSEAIRAEGDPYFSLYAKARIWVSSDAERAASKTAAGGESKFMDATSDWKNRGDF